MNVNTPNKENPIDPRRSQLEQWKKSKNPKPLNPKPTQLGGRPSLPGFSKVPGTTGGGCSPRSVTSCPRSSIFG